MSTNPEYRSEDLEVLADIEGLQAPYSYETLAKDVYRRFVDEYLIDCDRRKAGIRCGFRTPATAKTLWNRPDVRAVIDQRMAQRAYRVGITADHVLNKLVEMVNADVRDLFAPDGTLLPVDVWPEVWCRGMVTGIDVQESFERSHDGEVADGEGRKSWDKSGQVMKVKIVDRLKLIETLGRHVSIKAFPVPNEKLSDDVERLASSIDALIAEGRQRAAAWRMVKAVVVEESNG